MQVHQVYTESVLRNYTYLIELNNGSAIVIDPWDAELVNRLLESLKLSLRYHQHP